MNYQAMAFDMDGVVIDGMPYHVSAWQKVFATRLGFDLPGLDVYIWEGIPGGRFAEMVSEKYGLGLAAAEIEAMHSEKRQVYQRHYQPRRMAGIEATLALARQLGLRLGLVTGTGRAEAQRSLAEVGLLTAFEYLVSGDDVRQGKPQPEPYLLAAEQFGLPPAAVLVVENAPAGITAAKAAGMACLALQTSLGPEYLAEADAVFAGHAELQDYLRKASLFAK